MPVGESAAPPGVPARDDQPGEVGAPAPDATADEAADAPAGQTADEALDAALRELFAESRTEDPYEPPVVFMSWYRRVSGLL
jgi:hypothetical protein